MKNRMMMIAVLILAAVFAAGCKDEVDTAIGKLGGSQTEVKQAMGTIMSVPGARDKLKAALLKTKKYNEKTRCNIALILGNQAETTGDETVADVMEKALGISEKKVRLEIVEALINVPGGKAVEVLQRAVDDKDKDVGKAAWNVLDDKAKRRMAQADKLSSIPASIPTKISIMKEALGYNPCNPVLSTKLADLYRDSAAQMEGAAAKAELKKAAEAESVCGAFVRSMKLAWPFDDNFKKAHISTSKFNPDEEFTGADDVAVYWEDFEIPEDKTVLDMRQVTSDVDVPDRFSTYGAVKVVSGKAQEVFVRVGADASVAMWANGKEVLREDQKNMDLDIEKKGRAALKKGSNTLIFKITGGNRSRFKLRISDTNNKEAKGLKF